MDPGSRTPADFSFSFRIRIPLVAGHAARAIVLNVAKGDGRRLKFMSGRFTSPVIPGDEVRRGLSWSPVTPKAAALALPHPDADRSPSAARDFDVGLAGRSFGRSARRLCPEDQGLRQGLPRGRRRADRLGQGQQVVKRKRKENKAEAAGGRHFRFSSWVCIVGSFPVREYVEQKSRISDLEGLGVRFESSASRPRNAPVPWGPGGRHVFLER